MSFLKIINEEDLIAFMPVENFQETYLDLSLAPKRGE